MGSNKKISNKGVHELIRKHFKVGDCKTKIMAFTFATRGKDSETDYHLTWILFRVCTTEYQIIIKKGVHGLIRKHLKGCDCKMQIMAFTFATRGKDSETDYHLTWILFCTTEYQIIICQKPSESSRFDGIPKSSDREIAAVLDLNIFKYFERSGEGQTSINKMPYSVESFGRLSQTNNTKNQLTLSGLSVRTVQTSDFGLFIFEPSSGVSFCSFTNLRDMLVCLLLWFIKIILENSYGPGP